MTSSPGWGFALKKFAEFWLMPLPFCLAVLLLGLWLTRGERRSWPGRALLVLGPAVLLLLGNIGFSNRLVLPLEHAYPAIPEIAPGAPLPARLAACRYVVVLGSGNANDPALPALSRLAPTALARLAEGVRLARLLPRARLVVSGPSDGPGDPSHAAVLAAAAISLGIAPGRIDRIESAHDTHAEALAVRALAGGAPVALVTSAVHMSRAAALFAHAGVVFLPCPADFLARAEGGFHWSDLRWDPDALNRSAAAVRERVGRWWERLRRQVD
jgi:uncharacterized SAM-binding protein YcdF (DUF218 family)